MGINSELVRLVADYRSRNLITGESIVEIGAQDVCAAPEVISRILDLYGLAGRIPVTIDAAAPLYAQMGFSKYTCIDASGQHGALVFDLNNDLREYYKFQQRYDMVTNLGTAEHCFNQYAVFKNLHDLCRPGGVIIHALPVQGNVNHGFYNYHPRFFADLAVANAYEIISLSFTVDYSPTLYTYTIKNFKKWDSHDLLFYAVLRKNADTAFQIPFDGMFTTSNQLHGYITDKVSPIKTTFAPYLKGGSSWENTKGLCENSSFLIRLVKRILSK